MKTKGYPIDSTLTVKDLMQVEDMDPLAPGSSPSSFTIRTWYYWSSKRLQRHSLSCSFRKMRIFIRRG